MLQSVERFLLSRLLDLHLEQAQLWNHAYHLGTQVLGHHVEFFLPFAQLVYFCPTLAVVVYDEGIDAVDDVCHSEATGCHEEEEPPGGVPHLLHVEFQYMFLAYGLSVIQQGLDMKPELTTG